MMEVGEVLVDWCVWVKRVSGMVERKESYLSNVVKGYLGWKVKEVVKS